MSITTESKTKIVKMYASASVKVMRSFDYCHFEVALSDENVTLEQVDEMRKEAARLTDRAVKQYQIAKAEIMKHTITEDYLNRLRHEVETIKTEHPESEWTPEHKAVIKSLQDLEFQLNRRYNYEDDWDDDWEIDDDGQRGEDDDEF